MLGTPSGTVISNTAVVASGTVTDPDPDDNSSGPVDGPPVLTVTDLGVTLVPHPSTAGPVAPGEDYAYRAVVTNRGLNPAPEVVLAVRIPAGLAFLGAVDEATGSAVECLVAGGVATCPVAAVLDPAGSSGVRIDVRLDPGYQGDGQDITQTVTVSGDIVDPRPDNDTASVTGVPGGVAPGRADLAIAAADGAATVAPGAGTTMTVSLTNLGPSAPQPPLSVTVRMPRGVVAGSGQPGGCTAAADVASVLCTITAPLGPDATATAGARRMSGGRSVGFVPAQATGWARRIPVTVDAGAPANATLSGGTAAVVAWTADPRPGNDTAGWAVRTSASSGGAEEQARPGRPGLLARTGPGDWLPTLLGLVVLAGVVGVALLALTRRARREEVR